MGCNFFSNDCFFNQFFASCSCWKWEKIMEEIFKFFHKMAPLAQGVGQNWFFYHNFKSIQLFFNLVFALDLFYWYACWLRFSDPWCHPWVVSPGMSLIYTLHTLPFGTNMHRTPKQAKRDLIPNCIYFFIFKYNYSLKVLLC
jgi:hypothetical protein